MKGDYLRFRVSYTQDELVEHFLLTAADHRLIAQCRGDVNRYGVAVLLTSLRYLGYFPATLHEVPSSVKTFIAHQLHLLWDPGGQYPADERTQRYHLALMRQHTGWRVPTADDKARLESGCVSKGPVTLQRPKNSWSRRMDGCGSCRNKIPCGPQFATPALLFDRWHTGKDFPGSHTLDDLHNLGGTLRGHRLHQEVDVMLVGANLSKDQRVPFRNLQTDLFEDCIDLLVKDHASILGRTDQRINQDRNVMTLMQIFAHPSDNTILRESEASFGESDPQRLNTNTTSRRRFPQEYRVPNGFESEDNRRDAFWVAYINLSSG